MTIKQEQIASLCHCLGIKPLKSMHKMSDEDVAVLYTKLERLSKEVREVSKMLP